MVKYVITRNSKLQEMSYIGLYPTACIESCVVVLTYANNYLKSLQSMKAFRFMEDFGKIYDLILILCNQNMIFHM